jgi:hypothetical protein
MSIAAYRMYNKKIQSKRSGFFYILLFRVVKEGFQGLRSPSNRSLLVVNEDYEGKRNAEITF